MRTKQIITVAIDVDLAYRMERIATMRGQTIDAALEHLISVFVSTGEPLHGSKPKTQRAAGVRNTG